ncbi:MAG: hypothetical protein ABIJ61_08550 [bacterium]
MRSVLCVVMLALLVAPVLVVAENPAGDAEKGAAILDKFVEVTGGKAAYDKIENRYQMGSLIMPAMNIKLVTEIWSAKPDKVCFKANSPELGEIQRGFDGVVFWENSVMTGPRILEGSELAEAKLEANFDGVARWREIYKSAVYVGDDSVAGKPCRTVVVTSLDGKEQTYYFDKESNLLTKVAFTSETQMGNIPISVYLSDYRDIDGILISFKSSINVMNQERVVAMDSVAHNIKMPEGIFDLPAEIVELQKAQAQPAAPEKADE